MATVAMMFSQLRYFLGIGLHICGFGTRPGNLWPWYRAPQNEYKFSVPLACEAIFPTTHTNHKSQLILHNGPYDI